MVIEGSHRTVAMSGKQCQWGTRGQDRVEERWICVGRVCAWVLVIVIWFFAVIGRKHIYGVRLQLYPWRVVESCLTQPDDFLLPARARDVRWVQISL